MDKQHCTNCNYLLSSVNNYPCNKCRLGAMPYTGELKWKANKKQGLDGKKVDYSVACYCFAWQGSQPQIERAQLYASQNGMNYTGEPMKYCPWCGKELKKSKDKRKI